MHRCCVASLCIAATLASVAPSIAAPPRSAADQAALAHVDAQLVWRFELPLRFTTKVERCVLVDDALYVIDTEGRVTSIDAVTGDYRWRQGLVTAGQVLWGPVPYDAGGRPAVVFTTTTEALMLDVATGEITRHVTFFKPATASVALDDEKVYVPTVGSRMVAIDLARSAKAWDVSGNGPLQTPPVYLPESDDVVFADDAGMVHAFTSTRLREFTESLTGQPRGWIGMTSSTLFVTTAGRVNDIHALDRATGKQVRESYRLNGRPEGGPLVTKASIYQKLATGGLHRIGIDGNDPDWFNPHAKAFVAEWPGRVVVLRNEGTIEFVASGRARTGGVFVPDVKFDVVAANLLNDVAIVATTRGDVRCYRPAGASPIERSSFHVVPPQRAPTTSSAPASEPSSEPASDSAETAPAPDAAAAPEAAPAPDAPAAPAPDNTAAPEPGSP